MISPSVPDTHSLLLLIHFTALLPVNLLAVVLLPLLLLLLLLKQPHKLRHKSADRAGSAGDVHWFYGIDSINRLYSFGNTA